MIIKQEFQSLTQYKLSLKLTIAKAISNSLAHTDPMLDVGCNGSHFLFTYESVNEGHPDKLCD